MMAKVMLFRTWATPFGRFRAIPGGPTTIPEYVLEDVPLPSDAVVEEVPEGLELAKYSGEVPTHKAAKERAKLRALEARQPRRAKTLKDFDEARQAAVAMSEAEIEAEVNRRVQERLQKADAERKIATPEVEQPEQKADAERESGFDASAFLGRRASLVAVGLKKIENYDTLEDLRIAEQEGKNRKSVLAAIDAELEQFA